MSFGDCFTEISAGVMGENPLEHELFRDELLGKEPLFGEDEELVEMLMSLWVLLDVDEAKDESHWTLEVCKWHTLVSLASLAPQLGLERRSWLMVTSSTCSTASARRCSSWFKLFTSVVGDVDFWGISLGISIKKLKAILLFLLLA